MRNLTPEEISTRDRRREGLRSFLGAIRPALVEFIRSIIVESPEEYIQEPERFLPVLENWLKYEDLSKLSPDDRLWLQFRLAYVIAELMQRRFDAVWIVDEDPGSKFFLRYVLGFFKGGVKTGLVLDPVVVAIAYLELPPPRSLVSLLDSIDELKPEATERS